MISKNLAELKAIKISNLNLNDIVLGADSVIDLENNIISKPKNRDEALEILKKLNGKEHQLISSVSLVKNGTLSGKKVLPLFSDYLNSFSIDYETLKNFCYFYFIKADLTKYTIFLFIVNYDPWLIKMINQI